MAAGPWDMELRTPPAIVSRSEHAQIQAKIPTLVDELEVCIRAPHVLSNNTVRAGSLLCNIIRGCNYAVAMHEKFTADNGDAQGTKLYTCRCSW